MGDNVLLLTACLALWAPFRLVAQARAFPLHNYFQHSTSWKYCQSTMKSFAYYTQSNKASYIISCLLKKERW